MFNDLWKHQTCENTRTFHCFTLIKYFALVYDPFDLATHRIASVRWKVKCWSAYTLLTGALLRRRFLLVIFDEKVMNLILPQFKIFVVAFFFRSNTILKVIYVDQFPQSRFIEPASTITIGSPPIVWGVLFTAARAKLAEFHWHSISKVCFYIVSVRLVQGRHRWSCYHNALCFLIKAFYDDNFRQNTKKCFNLNNSNVCMMVD